jgi:hypothetical protein
VAAVGVYLAVQALVPLRHLAYPGNVSWTEQGHLFSWHMKLRDKEARTHFVVRDPETGESWTERPRDHLTRRQTTKMAGRPDMICSSRTTSRITCGSPDGPGWRCARRP